MEIEASNQKEWDRQKNAISNKKNSLVLLQKNIKLIAKENSWTKKQIKDNSKDLKQRIKSLNSTLETMNRLEKSTQLYSLEETNDNGRLQLNTSDKRIDIVFNGTGNFVHEVTHAGQFENGDIAFSTKTGKSMLQDVNDEANAYTAQYAYDPSSVTKLLSIIPIHMINDINSNWVSGIFWNCSFPYGKNGKYNTSQISLNIHSSKIDFLKAEYYLENLNLFPENDTFLFYLIKDDVYYKK